MSDALAKFGWKIRSEELAEVDTPFGSYGVKEYPGYGWRWFYCFDTYYDNDFLTCEDMAHGMSLAEEHWRDRVQPITKPLTDRIEELSNCVAVLEAKLSESEALLAKAVEALGEAIYLLDPDEEDIAKGTGLYRIVTTYKELTGGKDE